MSAKTMYEWFRHSVQSFPDHRALEVGEYTLSYAELDRAVNRLAVMLAQDGAAPRRVGLYASRSLVTYAGYLAILRLGATVVPLNPTFPLQRNQDIVNAAGIDALVVDSRYPGGRELNVDGGRILVLDPATEARLSYEGGLCQLLPPPETLPTDIAYILFTSGSTGRPKGVPIQHGNLNEFLRFNIDRYAIAPGCRMTQTFDLTFDPSVFDMFACWGGGATLVVPGQHEFMDPVTFVNERDITHWYSVPSVVSLAAMLGALPEDGMPGLRWSLFAGEQLTMQQARAWAKAAPASTLENLYGPTELSITVTGYRLPAEPSRWPNTSNDTVPIGHIYPHLEYTLRDGELCVRGAQRFHGYLDPAENAGKFFHDGCDGLSDGGLSDGGLEVHGGDWYRTGDSVAVEDGRLVHRGRIDQQIKIRGHRVELPEIEAALRSVEGIAEAVVLHRIGRHDEGELVAVCTGAPRPAEQIGAEIRRRLAPYMIPDHYMWIDRMPINPNGKIDRAWLKAEHA